MKTKEEIVNNDIFDNIYTCEKDYDKMLDAAVLKRNGSLLYGSCKPGRTPYVMTKIYKCVKSNKKGELDIEIKYNKKDADNKDEIDDNDDENEEENDDDNGEDELDIKIKNLNNYRIKGESQMKKITDYFVDLFSIRRFNETDDTEFKEEHMNDDINENMDEIFKKYINPNKKERKIIKNENGEEEFEPETLILNKLGFGISNSYINYDKIKNRVYGKIYPITRDYNCVNMECKTYKGQPKEAIFYKLYGNMQVWYTCRVCQAYWKGT
jgi:hypothetical protein